MPDRDNTEDEANTDDDPVDRPKPRARATATRVRHAAGARAAKGDEGDDESELDEDDEGREDALSSEDDEADRDDERLEEERARGTADERDPEEREGPAGYARAPTSAAPGGAAPRQAERPAARASTPPGSPPLDAHPPHRSSSPPPGRSADEASSEHRREKRESLFRETLRRAVEKSVEAGVGTFTKADSALRGVVDEVKLPKEFAHVVFAQVDETKNAVVRVVAREVRDFLEATDIADEFYRALTSLSFEIKTEIRFIPNDSGGVKPDVRAKVSPKRDRSDTGTKGKG